MFLNFKTKNSIKTTKNKTSNGRLIVLFSLLLFVLISLKSVCSIDLEDEDESGSDGRILKRQASNRNDPNSRFTLDAPQTGQQQPSRQSLMQTASAKAQALAGSIENKQPTLVDKIKNNSNNKKADSDLAGGIDNDDDADDDDLIEEKNPERKQTKKPAQKRRPTTRKPESNNKEQSNSNNNNNEDDDCYYDNDDDDDNFRNRNRNNNNKFYKMATQPIRQFNRMVNKMFNQMSPSRNYYNDDDNDSDDYGGDSNDYRNPSGSSSFVSAMTNRDGRASGIIAENRNGRTKIRRIGQDDDEGEEEEY